MRTRLASGDTRLQRKQAANPYIVDRHPIVLAHKGDSVNAPENTLPSFALGIASGADILETDVHFTKDGEIVVSHDPTVDRCSNGQGSISDMTFNELKRLDFGYRFSTDGGMTYPYRGIGVTIPSLRELLTAHPNVRVNVDVKPRHQQSLQSLVRLLVELDAADRVLLASFHHAVLERVRAMNPSIATSASPRETASAMLRSRLQVTRGRRCRFVALQVPWRHFRLPVVTSAMVRWAHQRDVKVHVWTIDDPAHMETLLRLGVDGIVSNDVKTARSVVDRFMPMD